MKPLALSSTLNLTPPDSKTDAVRAVKARTPRSWRAATRVGPDRMGISSSPQVAMDGSGNAMAVWVHSESGRERIGVNRCLSGIGWGVPEQLPVEGEGSAGFARVAMDASGNALVVWRQFDNQRRSIWAKRYVPGVGWEAAVAMASDAFSDADAPQVCANAAGDAVVVWRQFDGVGRNIWARRHDATDGWGEAMVIGALKTVTAFDPQVAMDAAGNAMAVWTQSNSRRSTVWSNRYTARLGWGEATPINTDHACTAIFPKVAIDSRGGALAVWEQSDGTRCQIAASRYSAGIGWGAPELLHASQVGSADAPHLIFDAQDNAMAVWCQMENGRRGVWTNRYAVDQGWGQAAPIDAQSAGEAFDPHMVLDAKGRAIAAWERSDGVRTTIWANRYTPQSGWGAAAPVNNASTENGNFVQLAMDASGNAIAVWKQTEGARFCIWASRFR